MNNRRAVVVAVWVVAVSGWCGGAWAQSAEHRERIKALTTQMGSGDESEAGAAVSEATAELWEGISDEAAGKWVKALEGKGRWGLVVELTQRGMLAVPGDAELVSELALRRAGAMLKLEEAEGREDAKPQAAEAEAEAEGAEGALGAAATAYRVATADDVGRAVEAVSRALEMRGEEGRVLARRWRLEQLTGTGVVAGGSAKPQAVGAVGAVGLGLPVDPRAAAFAAAAKERGGGSYEDLTMRATLLLLAGEVEGQHGAWSAAQRAYEVAPEERLAEATALVARAMRAREGSVAGANAWLARVRAGVE